MPLILEAQIALRYLKAKKKEKFISVITILSFLGIMLGVATLIIVMSVMNGFREELMNRILGINSHISILADNNHIENYEKLLLRINKIDGIDFALPVIQKQSLAIANNEHAGVQVSGISSQDLLKKKQVSDHIKSGKIWVEEKNTINDNKIIIGSRLALNLGLKVGDRVMLLLPQMNKTLFATIPRMKEFQVSGIFEVGMIEYDSSTVFMPLTFAKLFFEYGENEASAIEIFLKDREKLEAVRQHLSQFFQLDYRIIDWMQANSSFVQSLNVERNVMFLILTLIILVAVFNVISSMVMLVNSKKREIAVFSTLGLSSFSIARIFIIAGSIIGIIGTLLGVSLGVLFALNIETIRGFLESLLNTKFFSPEVYFLSQLPAKLEWRSVLDVSLLGIISSLLATIYPAIKAAKEDPVKILRYED